jgi:hypothetical protein
MKRLLVLICTLTLATAAVASARTVVYSGAHGGSFPSKPSKLKYSAGDTGSSQSLKLKELDWNGWGEAKAISPTKLKACSDAAGCFRTRDASVKAKQRVELDSIGYYTKLVVVFGQNKIKFPLPTP